MSWPGQWWLFTHHSCQCKKQHATTYVGQFRAAGPHLLSSLRLTSFWTPMVGKLFLARDPPTKLIRLCVLICFHIGISKFVNLLFKGSIV